MHHAGCPTSPTVLNNTINEHVIELADDGSLTVHEMGTNHTVMLSAAAVTAIQTFLQQQEVQARLQALAT